MPSRAEVERLRSANARISELAQADLAAFFASLNLDRPELARDALLEYLPALTDAYGETAAAVAAEWFDEVYAAHGPRARFRAEPAPLVAREAVEATVRYAAGGLFGASLNTAGLLTTAVSRWALQPSRDTVSLNASKTNARWARVPTGAETCAFCLLVASRGFVYTSEQNAGKGNSYHGDCDCVPVPDWSDEPSLEGYDPDALYRDFYNPAADEAGDRYDINAILAAMREQSGLK